MPAPQRYAAFISYRHVEPDRGVARWLHGALETFRVPAAAPGTERLGRVFRDEEELAASADLSARIDDALARADALVLVCTPATPASRWVDAEVQRFIALGRGDRIFAVLAAGEPAQSFPPALLASGREPLAADLRPADGLGTAELRRTALLKLVAGLRGIPYDALRRRDDERRRRRLVQLAAAGATLAMVFAALAATAALQWQRAERELVIAQAEGLATRAQLALAQAATDSPTAPGPDRAALLALESLRLHPGLAADAVLRRALWTLAPDRLQRTLADGESLAGIGADGALQVAPGPPPATPAAGAELARSADGHWRLRAGDEGTSAELVEAAGRRVALLAHEWHVAQAAFSADGRWLVTVTGAASADAQAPGATAQVGSTVRVWELATMAERTRLSLAVEGGVQAARLDAAGRWLATLGTAGDGAVARAWPVAPDALRALACSVLQRNLSPSEWQAFVGPGPAQPTCPGLPVVSE